MQKAPKYVNKHDVEIGKSPCKPGKCQCSNSQIDVNQNKILEYHSDPIVKQMETTPQIWISTVT